MLSTIGSKSVEFFVEKTLNLLINLFPELKKKNVHIESIDFPNIFKNHYTEVINWAFDIPFIGLSLRKQVSNSTIELNISSNISKYGKDKSAKYFSENHLLSINKNIIILGKPGAGKTTTVKRLLNTFFSNNDNIPYTSPILIRLRELENGVRIYSSILKIFNIKTEDKTEIIKENIKLKDGFEEIERKITRSYIKDTDYLTEIFLVNFLNSTNSIVFLDGFDELSTEDQNTILKDLKKLSLQLSKSKIILTSRTSTLNSKVLDGFDKYEIQPLKRSNVEEISKKWLGDNANFIKILYSKPYHELANRPIYLSLLLILFEKTHTLPLRPFEIYREATYLIIKDWDDSRDILRLSKYANFSVYKKLDFLQEIAFYLTYQVNSNVFSSKILLDIYTNIHKKYGLPKDEMYEVIAEIESHNGLISEAGYKIFEFSHLTLQEYLCAEYLLSLPYSQNIITYFFERPDPLAISICISKDPSLWFSNLLLNESINIANRRKAADFENSLIKLLNRLIDEAPAFTISFELGLAMIYLISKYQEKQHLIELTYKILTIENVSPSLKLALQSFNVDVNPKQSTCHLKRSVAVQTINFIKIPYDEWINISIWRKIDSIMNNNLSD